MATPTAEWTLGPAPDAAVRERLLTAGASAATLADVPLRRLDGPFPNGWGDRGNFLYVDARREMPISTIPGLCAHDASDAVVCLASDVTNAAYIVVEGVAATLFIGPDCWLPHAEIHCGGGSSIVLDAQVTSTFHATVDARNGGRIVADRDQLWATDVIVTTDDMHRLEDAATRKRINPFGANIHIEGHVWIARDVIVMGGSTVGTGSVIGTRSLVRSATFPAQSVLAGTPARVIREGTTWRREDSP